MQKGEQTIPISERPAESRAGDILLLPIAIFAFWTIAYQLVLIVRWPAKTIIWCFLAIAIAGFLLLGRLWKKTNATPGRGYRFHLSQVLLVALGLLCAITVLFVRRPNQDDVVYFHRALSQLSALDQPIFLRQTSVDVDAAAFSPVHLATSYEMLMAFLGNYLGIDPLYFYQIVGHAVAVFAIPFVLYWCARRFGLDRWPAAIGALLGVGFLLVDNPGPAVVGTVSRYWTFGMAATYLWQGKVIVWILALPLALALSYRFLSQGNRSDLVWLTLLGIASVGVSNPALYLIPAVIGCSWVAFFTTELFEHKKSEDLEKQIRRGLFLIIPLVYPIGILVLLMINIIPKPVDISMYGPTYMPWVESMKFFVGGPAEYVRNILLMIAVPLVVIRRKTGLFLFCYICAVWLSCLNPLLGPWWMRHIMALCHHRLNYLVPLPLLCAMLPAAGPRLLGRAPGSPLGDRLLLTGALLAVIISFLYTYRALSITPISGQAGWKSPLEYQLVKENTDFARAAGKYIEHNKLLAPTWTAGCELALLFPKMKVAAPRFVTHYFTNAGNPEEGILRRQAQVFVEGDRSENSKRLQLLEAKFRQVIESGRANAVAVPESESQRVLATLKSINPGWHRVLEAGGLVLILPGNGERQTRIRNVERDNVRHYRVRCYFDDANRFTYHSGFSLTESDRKGMSPRFVTWQIIMFLLCRVSRS